MDRGHAQADKDLKRLEKRLQSEYKKAATEVSKKANDYMTKFAEKDSVMKRKVEDKIITQKDYLSWRQSQIMISGRWDELRSELADIYTRSGEIASNMIQEHVAGVYALNHNFGTYEVERGSGINTLYTLYDKNTVQRLIKDNPKMLPMTKGVADKIKKGELKKWNQRQIQSVMLQGILQGKPVQKIAKDLAVTVGEKNMKSAIRNARTMTTGAENAGRLDSYKRAEGLGIKMQKQWSAIHDDRTRESHSELDGVSVPIDEEFPNGCKYPGDPDGDPEEVYNCRCTLVGDVAGIDDILNGDVEQGLKKMGYDEWTDMHSEK